MGKELSEMALEELWDLFPIFLVQHDERWYKYYTEIESAITDLLASFPVKESVIWQKIQVNSSL